MTYRPLGPEVLWALGPRPSGPWDLIYLGLKVWGPKVRGLKAQGLMAIEWVPQSRQKAVIGVFEPSPNRSIGMNWEEEAAGCIWYDTTESLLLQQICFFL